MTDVLDDRDVPTMILGAMEAGKVRPRDACAWAMYYGFSWSYEQIAQAQGTTKRTARLDVARACKAFRLQ